MIGFDDISDAEMMQMTTTRQLLFESGRQGIEFLLLAMNGTCEEHTTITLPTIVVIRKTTSPPRS